MDRNIGLIKQRLNSSDSRLSELYKSFLGLSLQVETLISEIAEIKESISNNNLSNSTNKVAENEENENNETVINNLSNKEEVQDAPTKNNKKKTYERNIRVIN